MKTMMALMKSLSFSFIVLASFTSLFSVADARRFNVGGNGAWVIKPNESYNTWAARNRFQVNDTLYFKYAKGSDSVLLVTKTDFDSCNIKNPLKKFDHGETELKLYRSGAFYFISGDHDHCTLGQKLTVVVLAIRNHPNVPISPAKAPKAHSPVSPIAPAKAPKAHSPVSPAKAPSKAQPPKSHSPVSPKSSVSPPPEMTPPNINAPAPSPTNAASGATVTSVMTLLLSVALTGLMLA